MRFLFLGDGAASMSISSMQQRYISGTPQPEQKFLALPRRKADSNSTQVQKFPADAYSCIRDIPILNTRD